MYTDLKSSYYTKYHYSFTIAPNVGKRMHVRVRVHHQVDASENDARVETAAFPFLLSVRQYPAIHGDKDDPIPVG